MMADELADMVEASLSCQESIVGGLILATEASGRAGVEVGRRLGARWQTAGFAGTTFEGVLARGRIHRDEPAMILLAWSGAPDESGPMPFALDPEESLAERVSETILELAGRSSLEAGDLILLFPDAHGAGGVEEMLGDLGSRLGPASVAGAGATGIDGHEVEAFLGDDEMPGAMIGLVIPSSNEAPSLAGGPLVRCAEATRSASPWLEITKCRPRWIDELDGEPALDWVRRQLGLEAEDAIEPHLDRLLARVRKRSAAGADHESGSCDERYIVGLDNRRGSLSWPGSFASGDHLALALPDGPLARAALRNAIDDLRASPLVLQFACRARDEALHGDPDLESAWVAHSARDRAVIGTVAPFQIAMGDREPCRMLVHSSVLAALGRS